MGAEPADWERMLRDLPPSRRQVDMLRHYRKHGRYRASDLYWLLGDQTRCVHAGSSTAMAGAAGGVEDEP